MRAGRFRSLRASGLLHCLRLLDDIGSLTVAPVSLRGGISRGGNPQTRAWRRHGFNPLHCFASSARRNFIWLDQGWRGSSTLSSRPP